MSVTCYKGDIDAHVSFGGEVAVDTETMGLRLSRDRLCVVQLGDGDGNAYIVQITQQEAPNLKKILADPDVVKIFHYARFDLAALKRGLGIWASPVYCTHVASRLARTYTDRHGLKDLCRDVLGVDLSKQQQCSDWGAAELTPAQRKYAAGDVLYLHRIREKLQAMLAREGREELAQMCFANLKTRVALDLAGWEHEDIFSH